MNKNDNLTFWMIVLGAIAGFMGLTEIVQRWGWLVTGARVCYAMFLGSGILLLVSAVWRRLSPQGARTASWLGAASAAAFAVTMIAGLLSGAIPCSGLG